MNANFPAIRATLEDMERNRERSVALMGEAFDRGRDCDHIRHAIGFLKPGGRLVAGGIEFRETARAVKHDSRNYLKWNQAPKSARKGKR